MLGHEFATLMVVSGIGPELQDRLSGAARKLEWEKRLTIFLRPLDAEPVKARGASHSGWTLTAQGVDKAGIVAGVARCLADRKVLISDLRGRVTPMPESGTPLYTLTLRMLVPTQTDTGELACALSRVGDRLDVEVALKRED